MGGESHTVPPSGQEVGIVEGLETLQGSSRLYASFMCFSGPAMHSCTC